MERVILLPLTKGWRPLLKDGHKNGMELEDSWKQCPSKLLKGIYLFLLAQHTS